MTIRTVATAFLAAGTLAAGLSPADAWQPRRTSQPQSTEEERSACTPDVFRLCSWHIPDVPEIISCLKRERRHLSPECRVVMNRRAR